MKHALVTGASRGIGRAVAIRLASKGWHVTANYQSNMEAAEETLRIMAESGGEGELLPFDVADSEMVEKAMLDWRERHPKEYFSLLVNNAGIRDDQVMVFMEKQNWDHVVSTTLDGFFNVTKSVLKDMTRKRNGRIINMASISGQKGMPGQTNYSAAKSAVIGATKALALEVASRGITVNAIAPGFIATDMTASLDEAALVRQIPVGRFGKPEEVAALACFLASDEAAYITGQVISINGGLYT